jgi:Delta6-protoilludene synthase
MHQFGTDLQGTMQWVADHHEDLEASFMAAKAALLKFKHTEDVIQQVAQYVEGIANWVRACDAWSFESGRYFGRYGRDIQESRVVVLL